MIRNELRLSVAENVPASVESIPNRGWRAAVALSGVAVAIALLSSPIASGFPTYSIEITTPRVDRTTTGVVGLIPGCAPGDSAQLNAIVLQESTAALAEGEWLGVCAPGFQNYEVKTKTVAGSPDLQDGPASVFLFGVTRDGSQITSVSESANRTLILRSTTSSQLPRLTVTNTVDVSRNPGFKVGDSWRLDLTLASPNTPVFLHVVRDDADLGVIGPLDGVADAQGRWSFSGTFGASDVAFWGAQAVIGSPGSPERSTPVLLVVVD